MQYTKYAPSWLSFSLSDMIDVDNVECRQISQTNQCARNLAEGPQRIKRDLRFVSREHGIPIFALPSRQHWMSFSLLKPCSRFPSRPNRTITSFCISVLLERSRLAVAGWFGCWSGWYLWPFRPLTCFTFVIHFVKIRGERLRMKVFHFANSEAPSD
jgi:hypothetical protein